MHKRNFSHWLDNKDGDTGEGQREEKPANQAAGVDRRRSEARPRPRTCSTTASGYVALFLLSLDPRRRSRGAQGLTGSPRWGRQLFSGVHRAMPGVVLESSGHRISASVLLSHPTAHRQGQKTLPVPVLGCGKGTELRTLPSIPQCPGQPSASEG